MINCIVVEDEPLAARRIQEYIEQVNFLNLQQIFDNAIEALEYLAHTKVDLIFLDIQMDGLTGIQFLETLREKPAIILTTAFDKYALKGFELSVTDYLLKPFSLQRFIEAVLKVEQRKNSPVKLAPAPFVFIKTEYRLEKVFTDDVLFIQGMGDYRQINTATKKILTLETFGELEQVFAGLGFCRVHKSFIVSLSKIDFVERDRIRIGKELIPVSETYRDEFYKMIS